MAVDDLVRHQLGIEHEGDILGSIVDRAEGRHRTRSDAEILHQLLRPAEGNPARPTDGIMHLLEVDGSIFLHGQQKIPVLLVLDEKILGVATGDFIAQGNRFRHGEDRRMVSVTPSGGWLQSSPTVPGLGFCLNSRAQMFWLKSGLPTSLAPGKRPRTTLTPSLGLYEGRPTLAFGTPGGDQQEQWQLSFFLRYAHHKLNLQAAIDQPLFHTSHFPGSFYPRTREPGSLMAEANFGPEVLDALRRKGHKLTVADVWTIGRLTAARRDADGLLRAAATPRLMQAYAIGR